MASRLSPLALFLLGAAALGGCSRRPAEFPIGIMNVTEPAPLARLRAAGFDTFYADAATPETMAPMVVEARRQGMTFLADPGILKTKPSGASRWPVRAWYIQDEPEVNHVSPEALLAKDRETAALDPRPRAFSIGTSKAAAPYREAGNIVMLDWYPVPHLRLDSVADQLDAAIAALPDGKTVWMIVQAFDWREEKQPNPQRPRIGRFPTTDEIRFMSYLAVMHGARGLFFFRLTRPDGKSLLDLPEQWERLSRVTRELAYMRDVFVSKPVRLPYEPYFSGPEARCWRRGRTRFLVLANRHDVPAPLPVVLLGPAWRPVFEPFRDTRGALVRMGGDWGLPPGKVLVLEERL
jgi:hypothetical protein